MTGFGHSSGDINSINLDVVVKSVNSRFLDVQLRFPPAYQQLEQGVSELIHKTFTRGRIELNIQRRNVLNSSAKLKSFDEELLGETFNKLKDLGKKIGIRVNTKILFSSLITRFDYFSIAAQSDHPNSVELDKAYEHILKAVESLKFFRIREGEALRIIIKEFVTDVIKQFDQLILVVANAQNYNTQKLKARLEVLTPEIDLQRVAQEFAVLADRLDVSEELARFKIHLETFESAILGGGGKKGEFLLQELGREINTIGNKAQSAEVSQIVIEIKTLLERIREQIMNIE